LPAKKTAQLRVHQLAKELGVNSKDIISKCTAEGISAVENHLSPVSVGLAATIREWFGALAEHTTVESAPPVNVETARGKTAPRKNLRAGGRTGADDGSDPTDGAEGGGQAGTLVAEPPASGRGGGAGSTDPAADSPSEPTATAATSPARPAPATARDADRTRRSDETPESPVSTATAVIASRIPASPDAPAPARAATRVSPPRPPESKPESRSDGRSVGRPGSTSAEPRRAAAAPTTTRGGGDAGGDAVDYRTVRPKSAPVMNIPNRPSSVSPAGEMLGTPEKATLAGPRVIRVEAPDAVAAPRPMNRSGPGGGRPTDANRTRDGRGGAGAGAPGSLASRRPTGRRSNAGESPSGRSGRAFFADSVPFEPWREQDLLERDQRLQKSTGFVRAHRRDAKRPGGPGGQRGTASGRPEGPTKVPQPVTVRELSAATGVKASEILQKLFLSGTISTINSTIDSDKAVEVMFELGIDIEVVEQQSAEEEITARFTARESIDVRPRAPVVTILGHVDHGKTSLLDRIRNTNVAGGEAGGITQKTSAFQVPVKAGDKERVITFIDTPGHEAFTGMRARGAKVTDIVVLVVAADDGVMPQTVESINHAKAAGVPIVVALNKIDKSDATEPNITRILGQLAEHGLNPTEWGGSTEIVRTSATKGTGVQDLLDILDYQAELLGLEADFGGLARGTVLEARMEEGRGPVASIMVQEGTLKKGNFVVIGRAFGRIRDIINDRGQRLDEAGPSTPVAISGIDTVPDSGDKFYVAESLKSAEQAADDRKQVERQRELATPKITLDNVFEHLAKGTKKELSLVVKADVHGSLETLKAVLGKLSTEEVAVSVKHAAVGGVNESDVGLAAATGAIIIGFNVTSSAKARALAEAKKIDIRLYEIIYNITDDITKAARGLLEPEQRLQVLGHAEVRQAIRITKVGMIAGCYVTDGVIERNAQVRVTRDGIVVEKDRRLEQLKRFKDDAKEVRAGQECGMKIDGYDDIRAGDVLECYKTVTVARG